MTGSPKIVRVPFGYDKIGYGCTLSNINGEWKPSVCIFPRQPAVNGPAGDQYPENLDEPPEGSILLTFNTPADAHRLVGMILQSLTQEVGPEPGEPAND